MKPIAECIETEIEYIISRSEEGKEISFQHEKYDLVCDIVPIERCVFKKVIGGKRCDYLFLFNKQKQNYSFLRNNNSIAYYVELKGVGLVEACMQLFNSIENTRDQINEFEIHALVVSSRKFIPQYDNNEYYRRVKRMINKNIQFEISPYRIDF